MTESRSTLWITLAACLAASTAASGAPLMGDVVAIRQPDGTRVELRVWGDEFYAVAETPDGFTVVKDPRTMVFCYARLSDDGTELVSTGAPVGEAPAPVGLKKHLRIDDESARERAWVVRREFEIRAYGAPLAELGREERGPTIGAVQGITLIIDFADDPWTIPAVNVDDYCNKPGYTGYGNNGSVRDYFYEVSDGLLEYTNYVPAEYYRAVNTKSYYTDPGAPYGERARELIIEALTAMENAGFDFSQYDADGDGHIDALNCFYAGDTWNAWAEGLWPHAGGITYCADGVCANRYQITNLGTQLRLGTFCHENGHMLMGWPDLYDYGYDSTGVGSFCLMCYGGFGTNPVEPCAYMKLRAGWANVTVLTTPQSALPAPRDGNVVYRYNHPELTNEYFLLENRQQFDRDAGLPDHGLAIWHIDTEGNNSNQQQTPELHYLVTLVQADGRWDLENNRNYGDENDLYASPRYPACTPLTYPNTDWWDGSVSDVSFKNISPSGTTMTFDFLHALYVLEFDAPVYASEIGYGETATYTTTLKNWGTVADTVTVDVNQDTLPDGVGPSDWEASFREAGGAWLTEPTGFVVGPEAELALEVRFVDHLGTVPGMALTALSATSSGDSDASTDIAFSTFVDMPSILVVDDDAGQSYQSYLEAAVFDAGYAARTWDADGRGRPTPALLSSYWAVLWTTANGNATYFGAADELNLMNYLDAGGNLFLASINYLSSRSSTNMFITEYLHVDSWTNDNTCFRANGVAGDPVSDGMSLMLLGGPFPPTKSDAIIPAAPADSIFTSGTGIKGLKVEEGGHKIVFTVFPFEAIQVDDPDPDNQKTLVYRVLSWFEGQTGVEDDVLHRLAIAQNAPNPFNPVTTISFTVPEGTERATLKVYSVGGRLVRTLVDGPLPAGPQTVIWDGRDGDGVSLASGVYFARLSAGGESAFRKMTLLK